MRNEEKGEEKGEDTVGTGTTEETTRGCKLKRGIWKG
jgi:hypothetical protein